MPKLRDSSTRLCEGEPGMPAVRVTVVVPAFNRAATIGAALRSVQAQTDPNWEVVVVDDGSRDETVPIVERFARDDPRVRVIRHAANRGAQAARNTGVRHARGAWLAFLDSDDRWMPHSLQCRLEAAASREVSVVHSDAYHIREDRSTALYRVPPLEGWAYRALLSQPGPMFPALLVTKEALQRIGELDERLVASQEWDTAIRLARWYRFAFVGAPTFIWDCRREDTITADRQRDARGYEQVVRKHLWSILRYAGTRGLSRHYKLLANLYREAGAQSAADRSRFVSTVCARCDAMRHPVRTITRLPRKFMS
jgi:hypothetical protein